MLSYSNQFSKKLVPEQTYSKCNQVEVARNNNKIIISLYIYIHTYEFMM